MKFQQLEDELTHCDKMLDRYDKENPNKDEAEIINYYKGRKEGIEQAIVMIEKALSRFEEEL